jgi:hypothetical protein
MSSIPKITLAEATKQRTDASLILGIDVDLVLGPLVGTDAQYASQARRDALRDMVGTGFIDVEDLDARRQDVELQLDELSELELASGLVDFDLGAVA